MPGFSIGGTGQGPNSTQEMNYSHRWEVTINTPNPSAGRGRSASSSSASGFTLYAKTVERPTYSTDEAVIHNGVNEIYVPSKIRWNPINIEFYEPHKYGELDKEVYDWTFRSIRNDEGYLESRWKSGSVEIKMVDGAGQAALKYQLKNAWVQSISYSGLDYSSSDIATITASIRYDFAYEEE